jgi:hypothetical protein
MLLSWSEAKKFIKDYCCYRHIFVYAKRLFRIAFSRGTSSEVKDFKLPKLPEDGKAIVYVVRPTELDNVKIFL